MVEIEVAVEGPARLNGLLAGLAGLVDGSLLAYDEERNELCLSTEWKPGDVDEVITVFESWLATSGAGASARLRIGSAVYELAGSAGRRVSARADRLLTLAPAGAFERRLALVIDRASVALPSAAESLCTR